jgi:hypothetical protein
VWALQLFGDRAVEVKSSAKFEASGKYSDLESRFRLDVPSGPR